MKKNEKLCFIFEKKWAEKILLKMKLTTFILLVTIMQVAATGYTQVSKFEFDLKGVTVKEVLDEIENNSKYKFLYENELIDVDKRVDLAVDGMSIEGVMDELFLNSDVIYKIFENNLVVLSTLSSQQFQVSGSVTSATGEALVGVTIYEKGTTNGTITDLNGEYSLTVSTSDAVLVYSFIGYTTQEIQVAGSPSINVVLELSTQDIDEVIVVGYTTQKKSNISGAISTVSLEKVENRTITHLSQALAGTTSGINVTQGSGFPGSDAATIYVRGLNTINGTNPLVVIDGVVGDMRDVSSNDVASISILKDAASSAIYGARAANGVILITTKKGKAGGIRTSYDYSYGIQEATMLGDFISNSADYMELVNTGLKNGGDALKYSEEIIQEYRTGTDPILHANTDWIDYVMGGTGAIQKHNLSLSGGTEVSTFRMSLGYLNQDGIQPNTGTELYSVRTSLDAKVSDKIDAGINLYGSWRNNDNPGGPNVGLYHAQLSSPMVLPVHPDGRYGGVATDFDTQHRNPAMMLDRQHREQESQRINGDVHASLKLLKGLTINGRAALNYSNSKTKNYTLPWVQWDFRNDEIDIQDLNWNLTDNNGRFYAITLLATANYATTIADAHNINVMVGAEQSNERFDWIQGSVGGFQTETLTVLSAGLDPETDDATGSGTEDALRSYIGNLTYNFKEKYFFTGNIRYDGSAKFHPDHRWGLFPAFSGAWRISKENFMENVDFISNLQLRAGWGRVGNNTIGRYKYLSTYKFGGGYVLGGSVQPTAYVADMVNEVATWETTEGIDIGLDVGLFNNSLTINAGVFDKMTKDILLETAIPKVVGDLTPPTRNLGKVKNRGFEFDIAHKNRISELKYNVKFNLTYIENEVVKYSDIPSLGRNIIMEGEPLWALYGYETDGIFQTQQEVDDAPWQNDLTGPGDLKFVDQITEDTDDDGIPDATNGKIGPEDRVVLGNPYPKFTFGLNIGMEWKGFDLTTVISGKAGAKGYLQGAANYGFQSNGDRGLLPAKYLDAWTPENSSSTIPRVNSNNLSHGDNDYFVYNTSYVKIQSLQIGYTLPSFITDKAGLEGVRVYVNGENLLTFADFEGFDPERNLTDNGMLSAPLLKTYTFGIKVNF